MCRFTTLNCTNDIFNMFSKELRFDKGSEYKYRPKILHAIQHAYSEFYCQLILTAHALILEAVLQLPTLSTSSACTMELLLSHLLCRLY